jgi:hypothetical protein
MTLRKDSANRRCGIFYSLSTVFLLGLLFPQNAKAVPASILLQPTGTQADVRWGRLENERFVIYFDSSQKPLATHALKAVERAYPDLALLLGTRLKTQPAPPELDPKDVLVSNFEKIPVIVSSRSDGASFANLISQSLEIQSSETPPSSLFQHELSHRMMYEHMDLKVGPAGRTFMLAMLPSWWTEGLPEYLTESLGRLETSGYLRAMVLNNSFLSWDRLHALYKASGDVSVRGYALSGRFFKYFLEKTPTRNLRELHRGLTYKQLIPPFFTGSYFLIHQLTGQWPGDLYESFKKDLSKSVLEDLEGMPRLKDVKGANLVFNSMGGSFAALGKTVVTPDFATDSRKGGLEIYRFADDSKSKLLKSYLNPLIIQPNDRIVLHPKEWKNGGFWTTSTAKADNRTQGHRVSYYNFKGTFDNLRDSNLQGRIDFPIGEDSQPPIVRRVVSTAPQTAAVLTTLNTESKVYMLNTQLRQHTLVGQWQAPHTIALVRPHHAHSESESTLCAHVIVNADDEKTSLERLCHGQPAQVIIPEGKHYIRDAIMLSPDTFLLLTGWHDAQAIVKWSKGESELIAGLPDWITSFEPSDQRDTLFLRSYTGGNMELWRVPLAALKSSHDTWIATRPKESKWQTLPKYIPYEPPFARYAAEIRKTANQGQTPTPMEPAKEQVNNPTVDPVSTDHAVIPAPYRYRHWMTYPNFLPPFLAGTWTFGFFSRPLVDEMERFYAQIFGTYYAESEIDVSDRLALEVNLVGNRLFDGWKGNVYMRPRFNGLTNCRFQGDPKTYVCQLYLREYGADVLFNRKLTALDGLSDVHGRVFSISPSSRGTVLGSPVLGAQSALLGSVGTALSFDTWNKVLFDKPVSDLSKRPVGLGGSIRLSADTTHSLNTPKAGNGKTVAPVSFQNYSVELTNSAAYRDHALTLRNNYSSTGGGAPLNAREFFRPFKTYIIGANDGLQDISTSFAGNGLLDYNLMGRAQYRNSLSYSFPLINNLDTRLAIAYLEKLDGELVLSRGGTSYDFDLEKTNSITTVTGSMRLKIDVKGYQLNPSILYGRAIDKPLWQLFMQIKFDQFW